MIQLIPMKNKEIFMPCIKTVGNLIYSIDNNQIDTILSKKLIEFLKFGLDK